MTSDRDATGSTRPAGGDKRSCSEALRATVADVRATVSAESEEAFSIDLLLDLSGGGSAVLTLSASDFHKLFAFAADIENRIGSDRPT